MLRDYWEAETVTHDPEIRHRLAQVALNGAFVTMVNTADGVFLEKADAAKVFTIEADDPWPTHLVPTCWVRLACGGLFRLVGKRQDLIEAFNEASALAGRR